MKEADKVAALVLAAGGSSRLGTPKQLLQFNGRSLLRGAAETALAADCQPVIVVLGAQADVMRAELVGLPVRIVENARWEAGMGSSIRAGMVALAAEAGAVLLMLCDQPLISASALARLIAEQRTTGASIVAAEYADALGVPALFTRAHFAQLAALDGQVGARRVIQQNRDQVGALSLPEAAYDVDTAADYERLLAAGR